MATKRLSPVQKSKPGSSPELILAINEYKKLYQEISSFILISPITEFKSLSEALSSFINISKQLSEKFLEISEYPLEIDLQSKLNEQVTYK